MAVIYMLLSCYPAAIWFVQTDSSLYNEFADLEVMADEVTCLSGDEELHSRLDSYRSCSLWVDMCDVGFTATGCVLADPGHFSLLVFPPWILI